jgi:DNA-binding response OmpR family regulator
MLMNRLWGYDSGMDERILDVHIHNLRKMLKANAKHIKTVFKMGYRIE